MKEVVVLRYGHRSIRDYRVTTHCCLVARAFGAQKIIINGVEDKNIVKTIQKVNKKWGSNFAVDFTDSWEDAVQVYKKNGFVLIHLTMYGIPLQKEIKRIKKYNKILVLVGSQKVERKVYEVSDYNISITNQPHSEIAAIAVFLDNIFDKERKNVSNGAEIRIIPSLKGKRVEKIKK